MHPVIDIDEAVLRENALAWRRFAKTSVRAVVKADAYGWGLARVLTALGDAVDGYVVADARELADLRRVSDAPAATLVDTGPEDSARVVALSGVPNIARSDSLEAALSAGGTRIRIGLRLAAGWSGIDERVDGAFLARVVSSHVAVEVWTHLADADAQAHDSERFARFKTWLTEAGVNIVASDSESTFSTLPVTRETSVRIGIGLFGARGTSDLPLACAITADAPIVDRLVATDDLRIGYGSRRLPEGTTLAVARCGYSDGFPRIVRACGSLLSVGMQYTVLQEQEDAPRARLLTRDSSLDDLAMAANAIPHELVCRLGRMRRERG